MVAKLLKDVQTHLLESSIALTKHRIEKHPDVVITTRNTLVYNQRITTRNRPSTMPTESIHLNHQSLVKIHGHAYLGAK